MAPKRRKQAPTPTLREPSPPPTQGLQKTVMAGFFLDAMELNSKEGTKPLIENLQCLGWLNITSFNCPWSAQLVSEFYASIVDVGDIRNPIIKFKLNGMECEISCSDLSTIFDISIVDDDNSDDDDDGNQPLLPVLEYPKRSWPNSWPLEANGCVEELNNGQAPPRVNRSAASKVNLTGLQRLALKLVRECLLPVNSNDTNLSYVQEFLVCVMMRKVRVNLPSLMLRHMAYEKDKRELPYGMIICHVLRCKGVDISRYEMVEPLPGAKIGLHSLKIQELYFWEGKLYTQYEVYRLFEFTRSLIWEANGCPQPTAPVGWTPSVPTGGDMIMSDVGQSSFVPPAPEPPRRRMTDREMLEAIWQSQQASEARLQAMDSRLQAMDLRQQAFEARYDDYQCRQTSYNRQMSDILHMGGIFDPIFGFMPTQTPPPPPPSSAPMDNQGQEMDDQGQEMDPVD